MAKLVADFLLERYAAWGVNRIYGYPGDGINGIDGALERQTDKIRFIQARHEEMAAFMACAHAKFTGEVGVCLATSGPGAIHLLNGLYDAKLDHQPVVAIVGQQARAALGGHYQQEVDLLNLFKDVASEYCQMASSPAQIRHLVDRSMRIARITRSPTCIIVPNDVQEMDAVEEPPHEHGTIHSGMAYSEPRTIPREEDLARAAEILNQGKRVAMLIGAGAIDAADEVMEVAERLGAGVAKALLGKTALADDLPYVTGSIGLLGTRPSYHMMADCDTLLMVGTSFPYSEFLPKEGAARAVQIDISPRKCSIRYPTEVNLVGDSAETLRQLLPLLETKDRSAWREQVESNVRQWWDLLERQAMQDAQPINPQRVFWELSPRLPADVILCGDSGSHTNWYARDIKIKRGMLASLSGTLATMGSGVPYAIAAKMAYPHRPVIAMVGDGAMQMNGNSELVTVKEYWQKWPDGRFIVLVLANGDLNQVTWEQRALAGDPKFAAAQDVEPFPYAKYAELIGLKGIRVDDPEQIGAAWDEALASNRPVVLEFIADPDVPPLPPHISWEQAKAYMTAVFKGDPDTAGIVRQSVKQMLERLKPGGG